VTISPEHLGGLDVRSIMSAEDIEDIREEDPVLGHAVGGGPDGSAALMIWLGIMIDAVPEVRGRGGGSGGGRMYIYVGKEREREKERKRYQWEVNGTGMCDGWHA
jgi:hypothetical protein